MACGGLGAAAPILAFSLEDAPQLAAGFFTRKFFVQADRGNPVRLILFAA